jgi:hypothetical protein
LQLAVEPRCDRLGISLLGKFLKIKLCHRWTPDNAEGRKKEEGRRKKEEGRRNFPQDFQQLITSSRLGAIAIESKSNEKVRNIFFELKTP